VEKYFSIHINFLLDFSTFALALEATDFDSHSHSHKIKFTFYLTIVELLLALGSTHIESHIKYAP
jgi:hypothetical protein